MTTNNGGDANAHTDGIRRFGIEVMNSLPYEPNADQMMLIAQFGHFLFHRSDDAVFLLGGYAGFHECHITPDWLLIYQIYEEELYLLLSRTGSHSDLF